MKMKILNQFCEARDEFLTNLKKVQFQEEIEERLNAAGDDPSARMKVLENIVSERMETLKINRMDIDVIYNDRLNKVKSTGELDNQNKNNL